MATVLNTTAENLHNQPVLQNFPPFLITSLRFSLNHASEYGKLSGNLQEHPNVS